MVAAINAQLDTTTKVGRRCGTLDCHGRAAARPYRLE